MAAERRHKHTLMNYTEACVHCHNKNTPRQQIQKMSFIPETPEEFVCLWTCEDSRQCDLTSNVLQRDGDTCRHLPRGPEGPIAELLVRTNAWATKEQIVRQRRFFFILWRRHTYLQYQMTWAANEWNMMRGLPPLSEGTWNRHTGLVKNIILIIYQESSFSVCCLLCTHKSWKYLFFIYFKVSCLQCSWIYTAAAGSQGSHTFCTLVSMVLLEHTHIHVETMRKMVLETSIISPLFLSDGYDDLQEYISIIFRRLIKTDCTCKCSLLAEANSQDLHVICLQAFCCSLLLIVSVCLPFVFFLAFPNFSRSFVARGPTSWKCFAGINKIVQIVQKAFAVLPSVQLFF